MKNSQKKLNIFSESELDYMNVLVKNSNATYLTNDEILENIKDYRDKGSSIYLDAVVNNFIKLLIKKARKYKKSGVNVGDLIHYGVEGIIEAVDRSFNLSANEKFITYITIIIERRMKDGLDDQRNAVALPKNIKTEQRKLKRKIAENQDREPGSADMIYSKMNVEDFLGFRDVLSSSATSEVVDSIEKELDAESLQFDILYILDTLLSSVERDVLIHSFGLSGESAKAFETIGTLLSISSTQKVRKIKNNALSKIRENKKSFNILKKYLI